MDRPSRHAVLFFGLLAAALAAVPSTPQPAAENVPPRAVYRRAVAALAWVRAEDQGNGTGWVLDRRRRLLVTNYHVVGENQTAEVIFPVRLDGALIAERSYYLEHLPRLYREGVAVRGKVLRAEPERDLALLELPSLPDGTGELALAVAAPAPGDRVFAAGCRYDSPALWTFAEGRVRQMRVLRDGYFTAGKRLGQGARVVEATVPINQGDSGGPLLDARGDVVAVAAAWDQAVGWFVHADELRGLLARAHVALPGPAPQPPTPGGARDLYRQGLRSFALVQAPGSPKRGSGFVIDRARRLLLTSADIAAKHESLVVTWPTTRDGRVVSEAPFYRDRAKALRDEGRIVTAVVLAVDARRNLALIEATALPDDVGEAKLATTAPEPGDALHGLGNPERTEALWAYLGGMVRQKATARLGPADEGAEPEVLLMQMPANDGEAGGPLFDERGVVAAVVTGKAAPQQLVAFALTAGEARAFVAEQQAKWQPRSAADWLERGRLFAKARLWARAVGECDAALAVDPGSAVVCCERAAALQRLGRHEQAIADCTRALALDARLGAAYAHRAAALCALGRPHDALADADAAVKLAPTAASHTVRARARRLLGDLDGALADCDEAVGLDARVGEAYLERGLVRLAKDEAVAAVGDLHRALLHDPHLTAAYRPRGDAHWQRADVAAALADYERALAHDDADALALLGRGRCRLARKDVAGGLDDLDAALRQRPALFSAVAGELRPLVKDRPDLAAALAGASDAAAVRAVLGRLRGG
jgi:S1-C subfamily serine protease